jgi:UDP-4-amino-4,6-dideoxy-N-acetyl-beta-L-altrosamine transaminase
VEVLQSDYLTQGPVVPRFEASVSAYTGAKFAVAVNSATSALHLACLALEVGPGDVVWTSPITFVASANCAVYCGAKVDFVDIDPLTYNISIPVLMEKLERSQVSNTLPKVVIVVHLAGQSCDMKRINSLSLKYGFKIIEDASHALGARYLDGHVGNCKYSDITVFSFHPVKMITTGEGGMAVSNNSKLNAIMQRLRSHGITRDHLEMKNISDGPWYYEQIDLGFNYRMTDIQAALGISQLKRLDSFVAKRNKIASNYNKLFEDVEIKTPWNNDNDSYSSYHLYIIRIPKKSKIFNRAQIFETFRSNGIGVNLHYIPIYRQPYYQKFNYNYEDYPEAENYYAEAISIPMYTTLTEEQQESISKILTLPIGHQSLF